MRKLTYVVSSVFLSFVLVSGADAGIFGSHVAAYSTPVKISKNTAVKQVKNQPVEGAGELVCAGPNSGDSGDGSGELSPEEGSGG